MTKQNLFVNILLKVVLCWLIVIICELSPLGQVAIAENSSTQAFKEWSYQGKLQPENWGNLSPNYQTCSSGVQQSPINLDQPLSTKLNQPKFNYQDIPLKILNPGNTIQINATSGNSLIINDEVFDLIQLHFHHPSEHQIKGKSYPMEAHFVHKNQADELLVLGVFIKSGGENIALQPVWKIIKTVNKTEIKLASVSLKITDLLPKSKQNYQYIGSLTTPPCTEGVHWILLAEPIELSEQQIAKFQEIFPLNARPTQALNKQLIFQ